MLKEGMKVKVINKKYQSYGAIGTVHAVYDKFMNVVVVKFENTDGDLVLKKFRAEDLEEYNDTEKDTPNNAITITPEEYDNIVINKMCPNPMEFKSIKDAIGYTHLQAGILAELRYHLFGEDV